jgi:hypothetical protein
MLDTAVAVEVSATAYVLVAAVRDKDSDFLIANRLTAFFANQYAVRRLIVEVG